MKKFNVAVIGIGFIGLPLSLSYAMKGANVFGLDINKNLIKEINEGQSHHLEYYQGKSLKEILQDQLAQGNFRGISSIQEVPSIVDQYIITVGVDVKNGEPQLENLKAAVSDLATVLKKGDTILLRSTVVPGTTEDFVKPILEELTGLIGGEDFYLAYSSERIAEGRAFEEFRSMPLALGGVNEASLQKAKDLLQVVTEAEIHETTIKIVETAKIIENVQRDVNIAMAQEFARLASAMEIDTFELIRTANSHSRVNLLTPGPGVGGYCLPNALYYLLPKANEHNVSLQLLRQAREINDGIPRYIVDKVIGELNSYGKKPTGAKVAVIGLAMKDFSNDDRISPPHQIVELLLEKGFNVAAYDPAVPSSYPYKVASLNEAVAGADALIYLTNQAEFLDINWDQIVEGMNEDAIIYDAKNRVPLRLKNATIIRM